MADLSNVSQALVVADQQSPDYQNPAGEQIIFARYAEDRTFRLFKKGSMLSDETAGYADMEVTVKALVKSSTGKFMVCIAMTRDQLDHPDAERTLIQVAVE